MQRFRDVYCNLAARMAMLTVLCLAVPSGTQNIILDWGRPRPYIDFCSLDKNSTSQVAWLNEFHYPIDPFILLGKKHVRWHVYCALVATSASPDRELHGELFWEHC